MAENLGAQFGAVDYVVFGIMLAISAGIGIFFAIQDRNSKKGVEGYLMAGRQMNFLPSAISLALTLISSVTILGVPAEIYYYGSTYIWFVMGIFWIIPIVAFIYLPFFYRLNVTSTFEYLGSRFNNPVRLVTTGVYVLQNVMFVGIMIYAPALALSAVTGFNLWAAIFTIGLVCTFYTTMGGLKAVIWTDVFQGVMVTIGTLTIVFLAADKVGGFNKMWEINSNGSRIDFVRFDMDPRYRTTFWSMTFGLGTSWVSMFGVNQAQVQRFLCCKNEKQARMSLVVGLVVAILLLFVCALQGFLAYAYFAGCDPVVRHRVTSGAFGISSPDQIVPYMVMRMFGDIDGLPGLYVASVFAGCLSTVSSGMNAMACVTMQDYIAPFVNWKPRTQTIASKLLVFAYGFLCIGFACLATVLGNILEASLSIAGIVGGPTLGVFALGMMFPYPNSIGAGIGLILGIITSGWAYIGSTTITINPEFIRRKPITIYECPAPNITSNFTTGMTTMPSKTTEFISTAQPAPTYASGGLNDFYSISYAYYAAIGCLVTLVLGLLISIITRSFDIDNEEVPQRLVWTRMDANTWKFLPASVRKFLWCAGQVKDEDNSISQTNGNKISPNTVDAKINMEDYGEVANSRDTTPPPMYNQIGERQLSIPKLGEENLAYEDDRL